jgi:subtilase family protein
VPPTNANPDSGPSPFRRERELVCLSKLPIAGSPPTAGRAAAPLPRHLDSLQSLLSNYQARMTPCFGYGYASPPRAMSRAAARTTVPPIVAHLPNFYTVQVADELKDQLAAKLRQEEAIEAAFVRPSPEPPVRLDTAPVPSAPPDAPLPPRVAAPAPSPNHVAAQLYLERAPGGIDARFAWTRPGGRGAGVNIIDVEGDWNFSHEDLAVNLGGLIGGTPAGNLLWRNHGTAVIGEIGADQNVFGCTGIAAEARVRTVSVFGPSGGSAGAIRRAADALSPGDIMLIELHFPGPQFNFTDRNDQRGYIAAEWWPDNLAAIVYATAVRGVIVVEAAGNGAENLDDPIYDTRPADFPAVWRNPFRTGNPQSGAIVVGAGAPPPGTHGTTIWGADRSRLDFSNFGARVDVQAWGREVTTTGYGDLGGTTEDQWYTNRFSGTSSASPIVVGALACLQGALRAAGRPLLTPSTARTLLRSIGSPQQDQPGRPATQRIGRRPDLRASMQSLSLTAGPPARPKRTATKKSAKKKTATKKPAKKKTTSRSPGARR